MRSPDLKEAGFGFGFEETPQEDAEEEAQEASEEDALGTSTQEVTLPVVTFSSDYGPTDAYVGICHLVIARIAPDVRVVDLVHGIRGVRAGAAILAGGLHFSPPGVHLAIVDPGVGTERRGVAVTTADGSHLVGPDNGLLTPAADALGGAVAAFELTDPRYRLDPVSATFHGRDIFAPAAAYLALGVRAEQFGPEISVDGLVRLDPAFVSANDGVLESDVLWADWYGNLELAAGADDFARANLGDRATLSCAAGQFEIAVGQKFADVGEGELIAYVDSALRVAIACNRGNAAAILQEPARVTLKANT